MNFLLARVAKLVAHARVLKPTILIKIVDMFVKWILKGRKCDKSTKQTDTHTHTHTHTNFPTKVHKFVTLVKGTKEIKFSKVLKLINIIFFLQWYLSQYSWYQQ